MPDKKRTFGQFETPTDVADLLLGFCLRRPTDRLLDPSCGTGAFLARAARFKGWLGSAAALTSTLWGVELDPEAADQAQQALPEAHIVHDDFFGLEPWQGQLFDAVIGNPPYTRAEWIGRLSEAQMLARQLSIFETEREAVDQDSSTRPAHHRASRHSLTADILDRRAGLHAHFFVHGTAFLREGGRFGFVVPNSWLDVAYGERLKRFLLEHYRILALIESTVERWFRQAKVNTCLAVLERCDEPASRATNRVRLARLRQPLRQLIPYAIDDRERVSHLERLTARLLPSRDTDGEDFAVRVVVQSELTPGEKWGLALRAPTVFHVRSREATLHPLKSWATVRRGFTTGANDFFYLDQPTAEHWAIEPQFLQPLLKSMRDLDRRRVDPGRCKRQVLLIQPDAELSGTSVKEYIAWGEDQELHKRRTCAGRHPWYSLPDQMGTTLLLAKGIWERHFAPLVDGRVYLDQQLYHVHLARGVPLLAAAAFFNSSWFALQLELFGRLNLGEGVLWLAASDLDNLLMPDPRYLAPEQLTRLAGAIEPLLDQAVHTMTTELALPAWKALNSTVFDIMGFTPSEGNAVADALLERMKTRQLKASTDRG